MILVEELRMIGDLKLSTAAELCIREYEDLLELIPASTSGRYHPPDERGIGGLRLHIRRMAHVLYMTAKHFGLSDKDRDILIFCAIVHDISSLSTSKLVKGELTRDYETWSKWHGNLSSQIATEGLMEVGLASDDPTLLTIQGIIQSHMGAWSPNLRQPVNNKLEIIFSMADYVTTRKNILVEL